MSKTVFKLSVFTLIGAVCAGMFISAEPGFYILIYAYIFIFMTLRGWFSVAETREKIYIGLLYGAILSLQIIFALLVIFAGEPGIFLKIFGILLVFIPFPAQMAFLYRKKINRTMLLDIITDIPRHSFRKYICKNTLSENYFKAAGESLGDENIYIIISDTGSAASEFISLFTKSSFNHASLSFDRALTTMVSFNGGEKVRPPGLNFEEISYFKKKADSSILVYRLPASREQKKLLLSKIREINAEGSAYNLLGLALRWSYKPNIMYCSQFVYRMLKTAGLDYFECSENNIRPMDFIEKDYQRKLMFEFELKPNEAETLLHN